MDPEAIAKHSWEPFTKKYDVHPESYAFVREVLKLGPRPYAELGVEGSRKQSLRISMALSDAPEFHGSVKDMAIPSPFSKLGIPATVYKPDSAPETAAILIYFHGGGLVVGGRSSCDACLRTISGQSGAIVISVDYRLLPDPSAPYAPFDDAAVATRWVLANREAVGGRSDCRVGVGGDSAGGQLSISATNDVPGLDFQILVYPMADTGRSQASYGEFETVPGLPKANLEWFFENSLKELSDLTTNPRINGMSRTNTETSPRALIMVAELDPLRDCGLDYAQKLRDAKVAVQCELIQGVPHAFFGLNGVYKTKCAEAYGHAIELLKEMNKKR